MFLYDLFKDVGMNFTPRAKDPEANTEANLHKWNAQPTSGTCIGSDARKFSAAFRSRHGQSPQTPFRSPAKAGCLDMKWSGTW